MLLRTGPSVADNEAAVGAPRQLNVISHVRPVQIRNVLRRRIVLRSTLIRVM